MTLQLSLLGRPRIVVDGHDLTSQMGDKPLAVLAYLALETPPPVAREKLANVFWQDKTDEAARYRLRNMLWNLRRDLGQEYIGADDFSCWLNTAQGIQIDARQLEAGYKEAARINALPESELPELRTLIALYRGDFLEFITVREAPLFEEWLLVERERWQLLYQDLLWSTAQSQQAAGTFADAAQTLRQLIQIDPLRERNYRALMKAYARAGDQTTALRVYDQCVRTLAAELAIKPSAETRRLRDQIAQGIFEAGPTELERQLIQAEAALAEGHPEHARTLIQSARQALQNLFN